MAGGEDLGGGCVCQQGGRVARRGRQQAVGGLGAGTLGEYGRRFCGAAGLDVRDQACLEGVEKLFYSYLR